MSGRSAAGLSAAAATGCGCFRRWRMTMLLATQKVSSATGALTTTEPSNNGCPTEKNVVQLRHSRARQLRSRRRCGH